MVSYWAQLFLTWLFGPLFILWIVLPTRDIQERQRNIITSCRLLLGFYDSTSCFSIAIVVAAIIRHSQGPPLFELSFLQPVVTMVLLSSLAITSSVATSAGPRFTRTYTGRPETGCQRIYDELTLIFYCFSKGRSDDYNRVFA